eukprot:m.183756 g.183756  ORF g.183756 m.183756 type:complete len:1071 (-) comp10001_c0_seq29:385-3597(-)
MEACRPSPDDPGVRMHGAHATGLAEGLAERPAASSEDSEQGPSPCEEPDPTADGDLILCARAAHARGQAAGPAASRAEAGARVLGGEDARHADLAPSSSAVLGPADIMARRAHEHQGSEEAGLGSTVAESAGRAPSPAASGFLADGGARPDHFAHGTLESHGAIDQVDRTAHEGCTHDHTQDAGLQRDAPRALGEGRLQRGVDGSPSSEATTARPWSHTRPEGVQQEGSACTRSLPSCAADGIAVGADDKTDDRKDCASGSDSLAVPSHEILDSAHNAAPDGMDSVNADVVDEDALGIPVEELLDGEDPSVHKVTILRGGPRRGFGFNAKGMVDGDANALMLMQIVNGRFYAPLQYVSAVDPGGPADQAGLRVQDRILEVNDECVEGVSHMRLVRMATDSGDTITLTVISVDHDDALRLANEEDETPSAARARAILAQLLARGADVHSRSATGRTLLHRVAGLRHADASMIRALLERGADVNAKLEDSVANTHNGKTALLTAITTCGPERGDLINGDVIRALLDGGADVNMATDEGETAVHLAVRQCKKQPASVEIVRLLLARGASASAPDISGCTPLHLAVQIGAPPEVARLLLDHGADVHAQRQDGSAVIHTVCRTERGLDLIRVLLDAGADIHAADADGRTAISMVRYHASSAADLLRELLARGIEFDVTAQTASGWSPLHAAAKEGDAGLDLALALLDRGAHETIDNMTVRQETALALAISSSAPSTELLRVLLARGADVNKGRAISALHHAVGMAPPDLERIALLLDSGASIGAPGDIFDDLLQAAVSAVCDDHPSLDVVRLILDRGADPNPASAAGGTFLIHLLRSPSNVPEDLVRLLLERGADVTGVAPDGQTALHAVTQQRRPAPLARLLLERGADVNARNEMGLNVLQTALFEETITSETVELARLLLDHGADPQPVCTLRAADGVLLDWSAMHLAILASEGGDAVIRHPDHDDDTCDGLSEVVELLLDHGFGVDTAGKDGWTALHAAAGQAQPAIVRALLARGADRRARSSTGNTPLHALAFGGLPDSIVPSRLKCSERTVLVAELLLNRDRPKSDQLSD